MEGSNGVISFEESGLQFEFYTDTIKYDDREFYKKNCNKSSRNESCRLYFANRRI